MASTLTNLILATKKFNILDKLCLKTNIYAHNFEIDENTNIIKVYFLKLHLELKRCFQMKEPYIIHTKLMVP